MTKNFLNLGSSGGSSNNMYRCNAKQSASFQRSFIDSDDSVAPATPVTPLTTATTDTPAVQVVTMDNSASFRPRFEKTCPTDCILDR